VNTVLTLLEQAKENLSTSYLPALSEQCGKLLNAVTNGRYEVKLDRNFTLRLQENGVTKPSEYFSRGIREITLLCFRVALSQMLYGGKIPLLIIDDAFVNFDEENFLQATKLLKNLSQSTQIVYFTCHERLGALK
ncbi:MAG: ATP-binding protein, partial [Candidatus Fimimonas sp.]